MAIKYTLLRDPVDSDEKTVKSPQVKCILAALGEVGTVTTRDDLIKKLEGDETLVTRQEPAKLINFYAPKLIEVGIISKERDVAEKPEPKEKAEKPAKEPKASKAKAHKKGEAVTEHADEAAAA